MPAALAALFAGGGAALLPFYPAHAAPLIAVVAGVTAFLAPRLGLALALAVPILPLGNVALGLAVLYAAAALVWLVVCLDEPEHGAVPALAPLFGPLAIVLVPLTLFTTRSPLRRAVGAAAAVIVAAAVHGIRAGPIGLGIPGSRDPLEVAQTLVGAAPHGLVYAVPALALAAALLPLAVDRARRLRNGAGEARTYTR